MVAEKDRIIQKKKKSIYKIFVVIIPIWILTKNRVFPRTDEICFREIFYK